MQKLNGVMQIIRVTGGWGGVEGFNESSRIFFSLFETPFLGLNSVGNKIVFDSKIKHY